MSEKGDIIIVNRGHLRAEEMSGGEVIAMSLCRQWSSAGRRIRQICTAHTPAIWSGFRGDIEYITSNDSGSRAMTAYLRRVAASKFELAGEPEIIYSASDFLYDVRPARRLKREYPGARWCAGLYLLLKMPSATDFLRSPRAAFRRMLTFAAQRISLRLLRSADAIFVLNEAEAEAVRRLVNGRTRVCVFPCGGDLEEIAAVARGETAYDAVYLGAIHPRKGVEDLLRAWAAVAEKLPGARVALAGTGDARYVEKTKSLAKALGIEKRAVFVGPQKSPAKFALLKAARVMAHPSYEESFAFSVLEGMACGLPVVAYDLAAYRGIYDAGMARVETGNVAQLAEEIISLLGDEARRARLSGEAAGLAARREQGALTAEFMRRNNLE